MVAAPPRWLDSVESAAWRGHLRMSWQLDAAIARDLQCDSGLSLADYYVLVQLSEAPRHRMRMSDLAADILWSKSRLSHQITRMEARRLVCREECSSDARGTFACLTPAGLRTIKQAAPRHVASVRRHLLDHLSRDQLTQLGEISGTVADRITQNLPARDS